MTGLTDILKLDKIAQDKYDNLKNSELVNLPRNIDRFLEYLDDKDCNLKKINRYHVFNKLFQELRIDAAVKYFQQNVSDLEISADKIITTYKRISEDWISEREIAEYEIGEFVDFVNLLR